LKKIFAILLLFIFGAYAFTLKSHYCYHPDGTRFHGDCGDFTKGKHRHGTTSIQEQKYICHDVQLDKQFHQQDYSFKNFCDSDYIFPVIMDTPAINTLPFNYAVPIFSCRGGPPLPAQSLRGPPLV